MPACIFPHDTAPADIGWKALAVNLSDLAAMGAEPAWCTLSLSLPDSDAGWLDGFLDGFLALAAQHRVALVGGDTTRGPLSICVTVHGFVEPGRALRRDAARVGRRCLGQRHARRCGGGAGAMAAAAQRTTRSCARDWTGPTPRVALGLALAGIAHACIDVSDGLLADLGHVCRASGVGAELDLEALPASDALRAAFEGEQRHALQAAGGDDYELCFTAPAGSLDDIARLAAQAGTAVTWIGRIVAGEGVQVFDADGAGAGRRRRVGYEHFG